MQVGSPTSLHHDTVIASLDCDLLREQDTKQVSAYKGKVEQSQQGVFEGRADGKGGEGWGLLSVVISVTGQLTS